jgi:hypothetical protein
MRKPIRRDGDRKSNRRRCSQRGGTDGRVRPAAEEAMTIEFDESFTTCEAHVIFAKQAGSDVVIGHHLVTGAANKEIRSATVTGVSCSVRDGNVFAQ